MNSKLLSLIVFQFLSALTAFAPPLAMENQQETAVFQISRMPAMGSPQRLPPIVVPIQRDSNGKADPVRFVDSNLSNNAGITVQSRGFDLSALIVGDTFMASIILDEAYIPRDVGRQVKAGVEAKTAYGFQGPIYTGGQQLLLGRIRGIADQYEINVTLRGVRRD